MKEGSRYDDNVGGWNEALLDCMIHTMTKVGNEGFPVQVSSEGSITFSNLQELCLTAASDAAKDPEKMNCPRVLLKHELSFLPASLDFSPKKPRNLNSATIGSSLLLFHFSIVQSQDTKLLIMLPSRCSAAATHEVAFHCIARPPWSSYDHL